MPNWRDLGNFLASLPKTKTEVLERRGAQPEVSQLEQRASRLLIFISVVVTVIVAQQLITLALSRGSLTYIAGVRTRLFGEDAFTLLVMNTIVPSFILFGHKEKTRPLVIILIFITLVLALAGGRSKLIYPFIAVAYWYCKTKNFSVFRLYIFIPVVFVAVVFYGYYSRYSSSFGTIDQYFAATGGIFGSLFQEASISMSEAMTINLSQNFVSRLPWDSFLASITFPISRSIIPWKPFGASTDFSMAVDYARFILVNSEWTVTGFVDLYYSFGFSGAPIVCSVLAFIWARILIHSSASRIGTSVAGPVCVLVAYQFIRGDIYIVSQFLWPMLIAWIVYKGIKFAMGLFQSSISASVVSTR